MKREGKLAIVGATGVVMVGTGIYLLKKQGKPPGEEEGYVSIRGRVVDEKGKPLKGVVIALTTAYEEPLQITTGSDGAYLFYNLQPDQDCVLNFSKAGYISDSFTIFIGETGYKMDDFVLLEEEAPPEALGLNLKNILVIHSVNGHAFSDFGIDSDGIPYAVLAEPITVDELEGVMLQFTYIGSRQNSGNYGGLVFHLWHQTPGNFSDFGPPGFRSYYPAPMNGCLDLGCGIRVWEDSPWVGTVNINALFAAGYFYPQAYDLRILAGLGDYHYSANISLFRVKNAIQCTRSGVIQ